MATEHFRFWCQKVLPLTYENSLSYYEVLCKLRTIVNNLADELDSVTADLLEQANAYTDGKIAESVQKYSEALGQFENEYNEFSKVINSTLLGFQQQIRENNEKQENEIAGNRAYTDVKIEQNNEYLLEEISKQAISVRVLNPFTGERVSIQSMIDYLSAFHMTEAATISEIGAASKSVQTVVDYHATCTQMVINSKAIFNV